MFKGSLRVRYLFLWAILVALFLMIPHVAPPKGKFIPFGCVVLMLGGPCWGCCQGTKGKPRHFGEKRETKHGLPSRSKMEMFGDCHDQLGLCVVLSVPFSVSFGLMNRLLKRGLRFLLT